MKKTIIFLFLFFIAIGNTIERDQYNKYKWAPISSLKKPFITFMNDFDHPTWISTNSITKRMTTARIYIPNNVDFSIICGVCIRDTRKANSLLSQSNLYLQPHIFNNTQKRISFTFRAGINKCLVIKEFTKNPTNVFFKAPKLRSSCQRLHYTINTPTDTSMSPMTSISLARYSRL